MMLVFTSFGVWAQNADVKKEKENTKKEQKELITQKEDPKNVKKVPKVKKKQKPKKLKKLSRKQALLQKQKIRQNFRRKLRNAK